METAIGVVLTLLALIGFMWPMMAGALRPEFNRAAFMSDVPRTRKALAAFGLLCLGLTEAYSRIGVAPWIAFMLAFFAAFAIMAIYARATAQTAAPREHRD